MSSRLFKSIKKLKGKTVVITGAANGIGRAWALGFKKERANVIAADIDSEMLKSLSDQDITTAIVDVRDPEQISELLNNASAETGTVDALFNNAGVSFGRKLEKARDGEFEDHVAIHLFGCVYGMRAALPIMRAQGHGRIINTISRTAEVDVPGTSAYSAAKAAIWSASRVTAREVSDVDILINMIIPGPTNTQIWGKDRPELQSPDATFPTAKMLATLPSGGPTGKVFWNKSEYRLFDQGNDIHKGP